jgi:hypothetical protein
LPFLNVNVHPPEVHELSCAFGTFATGAEHDHLVAARHEVSRLEFGEVEGVHQEPEEFTYRVDSVTKTARRQVRRPRRSPGHLRIELREDPFQIAAAERGIHVPDDLEIPLLAHRALAF